MQVDLPEASRPAMIAYTAFFVCGCSGMLLINCIWFTQLVKKAKTMISLVNQGQPPSRDYEDHSKSS